MKIFNRSEKAPTMEDLRANLLRESIASSDTPSLMQSNQYLPVSVQPVNPPVMSPVSWETGKLVDLQIQLLNRYNQADSLFQMDERIFSAVDLLATMIQKSYDGISLKESKSDEGGDLTNQEENALEEARTIAEDLDFESLFYSYTHDLFKYGDIVDLIKINMSHGVTDLIPLPINYVTAIDNMRQFRQIMPMGMNVVHDPQFYIVDEMNLRLDIKEKIYKADQILHISYHNRRNWIQDNVQRWTFNVWSHAPIMTLRVLIEWKQVLIRNDMLWRNRAMPREHHQLDLSLYDPSKYAGDYTTKIAQATADAQAAIAAYAQNIARREADQGFITDKNTIIGIVEPKGASYISPSQIINQINQLISAPTGTPDALAGGADKGMSALMYSSSFAAMRADVYSRRIRRGLEAVMKRHVKILHPKIPDDVIDRLYIKSRLILDRDRGELAKIVAVLTGSKIFTPDEIRKVWGLDPMTAKQSQQLANWLEETTKAQQLGKSPEETSEDYKGESEESQGPDANNKQRMNNRIQHGEKKTVGGTKV